MTQRTFLLLGVLVAFSLVLPSYVMAGDVNNPEIFDEMGEADSFEDIVKGWVQEETPTNFQLVLKLAGSPRVFERGTGQDLLDQPTFHYEYYFTCMGNDYAVAAVVARATSVPYLNYDLVITTGTLRNVTYVPGTDTISEETAETSIADPMWDQTIDAFVFTIPKSAVGNPQSEDKLTNMWAAVWNANDYPINEMRTLVDASDYAKTYTNPGIDFEFVGGLENSYSLRLSRNTLGNLTVEAGNTLMINISVKYVTNNPLEAKASVSLASTLTGNGTVDLGVTNLTFNGTNTTIVSLNYTAPDSVDNETDINITITGYVIVDEAGVASTFNAEPLNMTVTITPIEKEEPKEASGFMEFLRSTIGMALVGGVVLLAIIVVAVMAKARPKQHLSYPPEVQSAQPAQPVYYQPPGQNPPGQPPYP